MPAAIACTLPLVQHLHRNQEEQEFIDGEHKSHKHTHKQQAEKNCTPKRQSVKALHALEHIKRKRYHKQQGGNRFAFKQETSAQGFYDQYEQQ